MPIFNMAFKTRDANSAMNIVNLFKTIPGERLGQPTFGSVLHEIVFEPMEEDFTDMMQGAIKRARETWLPYINIKNIEKNLIVIPVRMASTRLPRKPLLEIEGIPMVVRVARQAIKSEIGKVVVACCDEEVFDVVTKYGLIAVMTSPELESGTDRVYKALEIIDTSEESDVIINLQGDYPTINPSSIRTLLSSFSDPSIKIATLASIIKNEKERDDINVVKVVIANNNSGGDALYFSRYPVPYGDGLLYHHIGIYAFTNIALTKYVKLARSKLEIQRNLEQMRALENNLIIKVGLSDSLPLGVDTEEDLAKVSKEMKLL